MADSLRSAAAFPAINTSPLIFLTKGGFLHLLQTISTEIIVPQAVATEIQAYNFIQSLSETARSLDNVVLVVSIPASEMEYTTEDEADEQRFKKMLDRVGKAIIMSAESETSEIIRRRLFEAVSLVVEWGCSEGGDRPWCKRSYPRLNFTLFVSSQLFLDEDALNIY